jgi:hypothetical protein
MFLASLQKAMPELKIFFVVSKLNSFFLCCFHPEPFFQDNFLRNKFLHALSFVLFLIRYQKKTELFLRRKLKGRNRKT